MKNVTISMDHELARELRGAAAKAGKRLSRYLADAMREKMESESRDTRSRNRQMEALERILAGPEWDLAENGRMPTAEERNGRR